MDRLHPLVNRFLPVIGLVVFLAGPGGAGHEIQAQTLYALVLADTKDPILARPCSYDVEVIHRQLVQITAAIRYQLHEQIIEHDDFGPKQLTKALAAIAPSPEDIILFYYTGHGYNLSGRADHFPVLMLEKKGSALRRNPGLLTIHTLLKNKKARLCITLGDCCNNLASGIRGQPAKRVLPRPLTLSNDALNAAYQRLFLGITGDALIASSAPPQRSVAHPDSGSFYTRAFDEALELAATHQHPSWALLLNNAQAQLTRHPATRAKQSIYKVNMVPSSASPPVATGLTVTIRTDRGRQNVEYRAGEQIQIDVKVNHPCHLRLVYLQADGTKTLLENDFIIEPGQENRYIPVARAASFICAAPFGTERMLAYTAAAPFCPIPTTPNPTLYLRDDSGDQILVGSMDAMIRAVTCTIRATIIAEDRIQMTTREKAQ